MSIYKTSSSCQIPKLSHMYEEMFGMITYGTFVEVGGYDGESFSNTSCLADLGWKGLYIEPVPDYAKACAQRHRENDVITAEFAIGSPGTVELHLGGPVSTVKTSSLEAYKQIDWADACLQEETIEVERKKLEMLLCMGSVNLPVLVPG